MANAGSFKETVDATIRVVTDQANARTIEVTPDPLEVRAGGSVSWNCDDGDWEISMKKPSGPLQNGGKVAGGKGKRKGDRVRKGAHHGGANGHYFYEVTVKTDDGPVSVDPEMVVGPEGSG